MRIRCVFLLTCALALGLGGAAEAQQPQPKVIPLGRGDTVTKVMDREGCDRGWLTSVLAQSNIDPKQVRQLPVGRLVVLYPAACKEKPPAGVATVSQRLFEMERMGAELSGAEQELNQLHGDVQLKESEAKSLAVDKERLGAVNAALRAENQGLKKQLEAMQKQLDAAVSGWSTRTLVLSGMLMLCIGCVIGFCLTKGVAATVVAENTVKLNADEAPVVFRQRYVLSDFVFTFDSAESIDTPLYKCSKCFERRIERQNFERHTKKAHASERFKVINAPLQEISS